MCGAGIRRSAMDAGDKVTRPDRLSAVTDHDGSSRSARALITWR
jgi:hypothetical protein